MSQKSQTERKGVLRLLLVDDDEGDVFMMSELMQDMTLPIELMTVENGLQAMAYLRQEAPYAQAPRPDIVLLDLNMPRMDGRQVLSEVRADPELCGIPIVVLTTSTARPDIQTCYETGCNAYLVKPFGVEGLTEMVAQLESFWSALVLPARESEANGSND